MLLSSMKLFEARTNAQSDIACAANISWAAVPCFGTAHLTTSEDTCLSRPVFSYRVQPAVEWCLVHQASWWEWQRHLIICMHSSYLPAKLFIVMNWSCPEDLWTVLLWSQTGSSSYQHGRNWTECVHWPLLNLVKTIVFLSTIHTDIHSFTFRIKWRT